jgi:hypothetical protein
MSLDRRLLNWGLFLILLGAIPLAVRQGVLAEETVSRWWTLWPLLLIAAGLGLLLRRTSLALLGGLLTAGTLGLILGGLIAGGPNLVRIGCGDEAGTVAFQPRDGALEDGAQVRMELDCGDLQLGTGRGSSWRLEGSDEDGRGPRVDASATQLTIRSAERGLDPGILSRRDVWRVTLPTEPRLRVALTVNAGRGTVRLGDATLERVDAQLNAGELRMDLAGGGSLDRVDVQVNAGSARINLPDRSIAGQLQVNAGSLSFCAPQGAGLRIRTGGSVFAANNFAAQGLIESANTWETPGYNQATVRIELDVNANAGSLNLNPTGGCNA